MVTRASSIQTKIEEFSKFSDSKDNLGRIFGTTAFIEAGRKLKSYMIDAGLETSVDAIGNVRGRLPSPNPDAKILAIGSHFDTIKNSGKYNGILGILIGIEILKGFREQNLIFPFHIEVIGFSEGEGVRFHSAHLGSKVLAGQFDEQLLLLKDDQGLELRELLKKFSSVYENITKSAIPKEKWLAFVDIHIEPGEKLNEINTPVAIADKISGNKKVDIKFTGKAAHAGSVTMEERKDALAAAARFVLKVEEYAQRDRNEVLATIGRMQVKNAATNIIPSLVTCSLDLRGNNNEKLNEAYQELYIKCERICRKRGVYFDWNLVDEVSPAVCSRSINEQLSRAITASGLQPHLVPSGLASESTVIHSVAPVSMLFVRDSNDVSYNPNEEVTTEDITAALNVTEYFLKNFRP